MLTRAELKQRAKDSMSAASTHPVLVFLIYFVIVLAISGVINFITQIIVTGASFGAAALESPAAAIGAAATLIPVSLLLSLVSFVVTSILATGLTAYFVKTIRHEQAGIDTLFSYFKFAVKVFCLYFMTQLLISLWTLLFVIPGIIATYRYAMAVYIFIDNPDKGVMECISESKQLMIGHKWEFFVLQFSFLLWGCLCVVTCGLASLYVVPYSGLTCAVYYDNLIYCKNQQQGQWTQAPNMGQPAPDMAQQQMPENNQQM